MGTIRLATIGDAEALVRIHNAVAADLTRKIGEGYWSKTRSVQRQREKLLLSNGELDSRSIYVFEEKGQVVGTSVFSSRRAVFWRKSMWREPDCTALCVYDLAVCPEHQGRGIGRHLMEYGEQMGRRNSLRYVRLDAFSRNPYSQAFYCRLGYENRGEIVVNGVGLTLFEKMV